jgi:predicted nucleotidyltransferase
MVFHGIDFGDRRVSEFCRANRIRRLSLFGSILRDDFEPDSDIDVLVEFEPQARIGLKFFALQEELSQLFGRKVDLHTPGFLSKRFRDQVIAAAAVQYEAN